MEKIIIIGGPGPAVSVCNAIIHARQNFGVNIECSGLLNDSNSGGCINNIPVMGKLSEAARFAGQGFKFLYTIYKIGGQPQRIALFNQLGLTEDNLYTFVHPMAYVAPDVVLSPGVVVMPQAYISHGTKIGLGSLILGNAFVGHDTVVGKHCFVAAGSCIGSYNIINDGVWIGFNTSIRGRQTVGRFAAIGIGSVVVSDIPDEELWLGNPARFHKKVTDIIRY